jgi:hypothetical protein
VFTFTHAVLLKKATLYQKGKRKCFICSGKCQAKFEEFAAESNCGMVIVNVVVLVVAILGVVTAMSWSVVRLQRYLLYSSTHGFHVRSLYLDFLNPSSSVQNYKAYFGLYPSSGIYKIFIVILFLSPNDGTCCQVFIIVLYWPGFVQWLRLALSNGPNWVGLPCPIHLRTETDPVSETLWFLSYIYQTMDGVQNKPYSSVQHTPAVANLIHLESQI